MGAAEIVRHILDTWPDATFSDSEVRLLTRAVKGVPDDQAMVAIDAIRLDKASRKPAPSWIYERMQKIRAQSTPAAIVVRNRKRNEWTFCDTLRAGWVKAEYHEAATMTEEELLDRHWRIQVARSIDIYGEDHAPGMLSKRWAECKCDYIAIGMHDAHAAGKATAMLASASPRITAEIVS